MSAQSVTEFAVESGIRGFTCRPRIGQFLDDQPLVEHLKRASAEEAHFNGPKSKTLGHFTVAAKLDWRGRLR